ncbi:hypothetical protein MJ8_24820 [Mesorhizobium sp. J8]|nr:hypothetical protein MJ8_24820 [Mesorhizobium sp. J8]
MVGHMLNGRQHMLQMMAVSLRQPFEYPVVSSLHVHARYKHVLGRILHVRESLPHLLEPSRCILLIRLLLSGRACDNQMRNGLKPDGVGLKFRNCKQSASGSNTSSHIVRAKNRSEALGLQLYRVGQHLLRCK